MTDEVEVVTEEIVQPPVEAVDTPIFTEVRNITIVSEGVYNCEANHKDYGWIPFTANPSCPHDTTAQALALIDKAVKKRGFKKVEDPSVKIIAEYDARVWRDGELSRADVLINKIEDFEIEGESKPWRQYRVALRNWPAAEGFPSVESRPSAPDA